MIRTLIPAALGALMGAMMLMLAHPYLTGDKDGLGWALAGFVAAHLVVLAGLALLAGWAATRWTGLRLPRHRPSLRHMGLMAAGAGGAALIIHLIHGGPL